MPIGKEIGSYSAKATSITKDVDAAGNSVFVLNLEGSVSGGWNGTVLSTLITTTGDFEAGTYTSSVSVYLEDGSVVWISRGRLRHVLKASSAIPGILPAVSLNGRQLVDGGVVGEVPIGAARSMGWPVVAVDVSMDLPPMRDSDLVLDTMMRTQMMTSRLLRERMLSTVRAVIRPQVGYATWAEWHHFDDLVAEGCEVYLMAHPSITHKSIIESCEPE